jgi:hypothetical protein
MASVALDRIHNLLVNPYVKETRRGGARYPSSSSTTYINQYGEDTVVGTCLRRQWYASQDYEETGERNAEGTMKALAGNLWSQFLVDRIKEAGFWYGDETSFYNAELNVSGRVDVIVAEEGTRHPVGVEIKTVGTFVSKGVIKPTAAYPLAPKEDHVLQTMIYLYHYRNAIKKWVLLYMDRNTMEMAEHVVRLEEEDGYHYPVISNEMGVKEWKHIRVEDIIRRWQELEIHIKNKTLPERDYELQYANSKIAAMYNTGRLTKTDSKRIQRRVEAGEVDDNKPPLLEKGDWQCRFCPFLQECYREEIAPDQISNEQMDATL